MMTEIGHFAFTLFVAVCQVLVLSSEWIDEWQDDAA